jgi:sugar lactone lactonase YvrE
VAGGRSTVIALAGHDKAMLGEGPLWDHRDDRLLWVDIVEGAIIVLSPATSTLHRIDLGESVGCLALTARSDTVVAALRSGWYWVNLETSEKQLIASSPVGKSCRFNDGAVDRAGRFWVGTLEDGERNPTGELFRLDADLTYRSMDQGFLCSNGIAWSPDQTWMFFVDSRRDAIYRYRTDVEEGTIGARDLFVDTSDLAGIPDGIAMDSDGVLWCAFWDGAQVVGFDSDGVTRATINVPALRPTSIAFGGQQLQTMYITSARYGLSEMDLRAWPSSGSVFEVDSRVPGLPTNVLRAVPWTTPR